MTPRERPLYIYIHIIGALEYDPSRGAAIAPHIDDSWIWGERIVTCSLLSCSIMEFVRGIRRIFVSLPPRSVLILSGNVSYEEEDTCVI